MFIELLLCARQGLSAPPVASHLILSTTLREGSSCRPRFRLEETAVEGGRVTGLALADEEPQGQGSCLRAQLLSSFLNCLSGLFLTHHEKYTNHSNRS